MSQIDSGLAANAPDVEADIQQSRLYNDDLAPVPASRRKWGMLSFAALWISMSACIPTYMLASGLISGGMNWSQAILTIFLGERHRAHSDDSQCARGHALRNSVSGLLPRVVRNSGRECAGDFARARRVRLVRNSNVDWRRSDLQNLRHDFQSALPPRRQTGSGSPADNSLCFLFFWGVNMFVIYRGIDTIRWLLNIKAPLLIALGLLLLWWAYRKAGGFGPILSQPSQFDAGQPKAGQFWKYFFPALTGMVGFWATLSLNIPDFSRYAKTQRDQVIGQALGLPLTMALYSFIGVAVTSATTIIFGTTDLGSGGCADAISKTRSCWSSR